MKSIRARLLVALIILVALVSLFAAAVAYRRVLSETSDLFDYQLRQMALSLRSQISLAPRIEVPPDQSDTDFVVQIWDVFGTRVYLSHPGLPMIDRVRVGYANLSLRGAAWRAYGLQTSEGVIQIAQPLRVRESLARAAALRVIVPLLLLLPIVAAAVAWIVSRGLLPLRHVIADVQRRDVRSLEPLVAMNLPQEIEPLVCELNRLLARLHAAFTAQRSFIADAAHELRSPLTALRLQLQLLDRAPDQNARLEAREWLGAAVERAVRLAEQLLALARNDPQEKADFAVFDLSDAVAEGIKDSHSLAVARGIDLGLDAEPHLMLPGDREGVRTLVRNLVDNAVRYTPAGGSVRVRSLATTDGAVVEVADTGSGIPPSDRVRVFDRFYRRLPAREGGTGLGLAIVKAIAERHGAQVTIDDAAGGGLRVAVIFPRAS